MPNDYSIRLKIWIEKRGVSILGPGRIEILEAIEKTNSLTKATRDCHISFRKGWKLINDISQHLEQQVIISERGGKGGGGKTILTEYGKKLIKQYRSIQEKLTALANSSQIWDDFK